MEPFSILFLLAYLVNYITTCKYGVICCYAYGVDIVTFKTGTTPFQKSRIDLLRFNPRFVLLPFVLGKPFSSFRTLSNLCIWAILCSLVHSYLWIRQLSKLCWGYGLGHIIFFSIYGYNNADQLVVSLSPLFLFLYLTHTHFFSLTFFRRSTQKCQPSSFLTFVVTTLAFFLSVIVQCVYVKCFRFQQTLFICPKIRLHENVVLKRLQQQIVPLFSNSCSMLIICL